VSQAEPLPFVETPAPPRTGELPATLPERGGRAARLGIRLTLLLLIATGIGVFAAWEMRTFGFEAYLFHNAARDAAFEVRSGAASWDIPAPSGPYDRRMGYTGLRNSIAVLHAQGFEVVAQARSNDALERIARLGLFPPYHEKPQAGLHITGRTGTPLFSTVQPSRTYARFEDIPPVLVASLLFIENRELLDQATPRRNPAVEWDRLVRALWTATGSGGPGGSTLATQIEKFRHSPEGITSSPREKLRQMLSASLRAYRGGDFTLAARRQIVVDYLNGVPLSAVPGGGEVIGLGDGLAAWYGANFDDVNRRLTPPLALDGDDRDRVARDYVLALSLFVAQRRPTTLLLEHPEELLAQTRAQLPRLARAGVISKELRDAALAVSFRPAGSGEPDGRSHRLARRLSSPVRARLAAMLGTHGFYDLDRLDLSVESTLDVDAQKLLSGRVDRLSDPEVAAAAGLVGMRLLDPGSTDGVKFSLNVYERGVDAHRLRAQVDNSEGALDLSDGVKLDLGSTAKLRTLVTYLELIAQVYDRLAALPVAERAALPLPRSDRLARWVQEELVAHPKASLAQVLDASLERRYSASPYAPFFTGGGEHRFSNFDKADNERRPSVREAFQRSVNLVFVRLMRDVVDHVTASQLDADAILSAPSDDSRRRAYLWLFAHSEGSVFLAQAYSRFAALEPDRALGRLYANRRPSAKAVSAAIRATDPHADFEQFSARLAALLPEAQLADNLVAKLYAQSDPARWSLQDRGYLAKVHPLELWLLAHLREHPRATLAEVLDASRGERLDSYRWLFRSGHRGAQNRRIRTMLEREAFRRIHTQWQATGYPFPSLVPSLATALGTSADRPTALAELMGIIASDGVRVPLRRIETMRFAADTPYETRVAPTPSGPDRVLRPEVCAVLQRALVSTVEGGTAARARGALRRADGSAATVGGKTGTGDHRYKVMARGQRVLEERPVSRSATFVFLIDDRFFGVLTAVVTGPEAGRYHFTSSLPVQIFTALMPEVLPVLETRDATAAPQVALARDQRLVR
jgi:membrane peptidoglycan carboxypeptidase